MSRDASFDAWTAGQNYDRYMGRWSRAVANRFLAWLDPQTGLDWLEVGCGTGALTAAILDRCDPRSVWATDPSDGFVAHTRAAISDGRARFDVADAAALPGDDQSVDVVTSALAFNFFPDRQAALGEMRRILRPSGRIAFYVWDYPSGGVGFIDAFWKAAAKLDPKAAKLDEARRFPFCVRDGLLDECRAAGLADVVVESLEIETTFPDFDALWQPFTLGAGPAPGYCVSLDEAARSALKAELRRSLGSDAPIRLLARAWAVRADR